jgi:hypothetical protein
MLDLNLRNMLARKNDQSEVSRRHIELDTLATSLYGGSFDLVL